MEGKSIYAACVDGVAGGWGMGARGVRLDGRVEVLGVDAAD